jgi:hypothetical protein
MRNAVFGRKATYDLVRAIVGTSYPFVLYGFQANNIASLVVDNEYGESTFDMTLSGVGAWTANGGWYQQPAGLGQGLRNDGGVSSWAIDIDNGLHVNMNTRNRMTVLAKIRLNTLGEGLGGTLIYKDAGYYVRFVTVDEIEVGLWSAGAWSVIVTTDSPLAGGWGYWHDLAITYDGATVGIIWDGAARAVAGAVPAAVADGVNNVIVMDDPTNARAMDGDLGFLCIVPGYAMSVAETRYFIELGPLCQVTAANQPTILRFTRDEYAFDGLVNSRHFRSYQIYPVMGRTGTILAWFRPEDFLNQQSIIGVFQDGVNNDGISLQIRGDVANDPVELVGRTGGAANLRLAHPFAATAYGGRHFLAVTSDGLAVRMYWNGVVQTITATLGANTGQWTATYPASTQIVVGVTRGAAVTEAYGGKIIKLVMYDRELLPPEIDALMRYGWWRALPRE